jgi:phage head maturation protease
MIYKFITEADAKEFNDSERSFVAWASKSSIDRQDEEIDPSGWIMDNYEKNPVVPLFHDYGRFPIAKAGWVKKSPRVNPEGLLFKPIFAKTEIGEEAFYLYKEGFMSAFSVGFDPIEWQDGEGKTYSKAVDGDFGIWQKAYIQKARKKPRCKYLKQELLEISGVLVPAHPDALIEARGIVKTKELSEYLDSMIKQTTIRDIKSIIIAEPDGIKDFMIMDWELQKRYIDVIRKLAKVADRIDNNELGELISSCAFELNDLWNYADHKSKITSKKIDTIDASEYEDEEIDIELDDDLEIEIDQDGDIEIEEISVEI